MGKGRMRKVKRYSNDFKIAAIKLGGSTQKIEP